MTRTPTDNLDEIQSGPSGLELIQIDEIAGLDNPKITTPHARSPEDILAQLEIERSSGREGAANPLHDLKTIYDDEKILEVSLVTLV
jgi:hypothetical protein